MKAWKTLSLCPLMAAMALPVQADTLLGIRIGGQYWNMDGDGTLGNADDSSRADFDFDREGQGTYYVSLEHFIPLLPNVKVKHTELETNGSDTVSNFDFEGFTFDGRVNSDVDFSHTDLILYYELLDNWVSLDLGLNIMQIDGSVSVTEVDTATTERVDFDGYLPTLYVAVEGQLPFTGFSIAGEVSGLAGGGHQFYDAQAQLQYKVIDNIAFDIELQAGYRQTRLKLDDIDDLDTDIEFSGPFAGIQIHF
ncbi:TIGR04219 family outer membrane beta-barrel protein [Motiliproteus sp. SC1-56]|uniref:TIGR04219 family outer membrane beta-barrel protein n=1 Tax=Motiliproteus sp. SC1-56 TaxID=2799565 RepID=UPI001A8EF5F4|nr:TIGR04219 family outer membrane beta-barrel protein [Motiliproteus sp. SC1-56]